MSSKLPVLKEAILYNKLDNNNVKCYLCAHHCLIHENKKGYCLVRENHNGILYTLAYGKTNSYAVDPVEKKPLFHFHPGSKAFSIATAGCNFHCRFCQNWQISQVLRAGGSIMGDDFSPAKIVDTAKKTKCRSIAYTYTEPTIYFEYAYETSVLAREQDIKNIFVTNGYITSEALNTIHQYLDAANVDLKGFTEDFYHKWASAKLQPVLDSLKLMKKLNIWVEITTLIIPTLNDNKDILKQMANFIVKELGAETPWHISRFYPAYDLLELPQTPIETLEMARRTGLEAGLRYVYVGNVPGSEGSNTYCYNCGKLLIRRYVNNVLEKKTVDGCCYNCKTKIDGVGI